MTLHLSAGLTVKPPVTMFDREMEKKKKCVCVWGGGCTVTVICIHTSAPETYVKVTKIEFLYQMQPER